ncbi:mitochondrial enolase superfamily member 1 isoform X1 [Globicephala melas]|uniref:mitochondrial enolase superfamily member 1 isoform X1 n=1 Tax=Globicephala melas TaxID=9731 RepID=UPI00293D63BC|nr:mitochondrial enolase superfamily member 1 isoform X1 [Globicephala melas]
MVRGRISRLSVRDVRFPTSLGGHGSDAMHTDPDYSAAYVVLETDAEDGLKGYGITFTLGKGTEVVVCAVNALAPHLLNKDLGDIVGDFRGFYRQLTSDSQLRWIGPEKGVVHLATSAVLNAVWDLWAKQEGKPLWKLLVDMDPRKLVSCLDFRYITDVLTEEEAYEILQKGQVGKKEREEQMLAHGYPAYTTSCAWLGYSDTMLKQLCSKALEDGWTRFKVKVGADLQDDIRRCRLIRNMIGPEKTLMMDANQRWDVPEAVEWMAKLAEFKPLWIEEPTSPDDILGHATISKALVPLGIGVATGEQCHNRVIFKQLLQAKALQFLQIDSCRLGSVNENLSVLLMAKKFDSNKKSHRFSFTSPSLPYLALSGNLSSLLVPVCPHAGGVGLCELVQHLIIFDFISVSASLKDRMCEYVDHLHEHFTYPVIIKKASYMPPKDAGYSTEMKEESVKKHQYPDGEVWEKLLAAQGN